MTDLAADSLIRERDTAAGASTGASAVADLERHRPELTGYCYRMLGSPFEAEDAIQETLARAWQRIDRFDERRGMLGAWLFAIATNVCFDRLRSRRRRARAVGLGPPSEAGAPLGVPLPEERWVQLDATVPAVNSALQRARVTLQAREPDPAEPLRPSDGEQRDLLARFAAAFERYDVDALVSLLHEDATMSSTSRSSWRWACRSRARSRATAGSWPGPSPPAATPPRSTTATPTAWSPRWRSWRPGSPPRA